jgi:hypothetical protein
MARPIIDEKSKDYALGKLDGSTSGRVYGHSFNPGWVTPQERYDNYRAGYDAGRKS